ncbi:carbon-nitrogen hydrolase family protein [Burkholderia cenocepacia]|jgi:aliphatic nitrilase|uniref:carbon-nitrogen hydrolase family protein n=1 Tax=Burkholderia cenocepacia TaxID=95486 RepID=UPI0004F5B57C|nr:carbon-nitrogen hydrolase family protein [Burkholderia cenocepacia]AIO43483.1 carbon-nitrogen hydrolase family protein [Burkholderia cepacia]KGC04887.1 carbon-nitrogen hydrolase family protein [Burkholderia cepacia]MCG0576826.1 carbon-nitrogen hydrolase family protein [Burkholderia cenocepacia]MCW3524467.1 carbon-nitrogen hydrolase family protein [Burkholderia cenocepacia]MCW3614689.1 carbon-nitrogen hydrolase family protein [Burkholderia cenocepacia]
MTLPTVKVAAAHAASVYMDAQASTKKAVSIIEEASRNGAELISFPESFIPGFPVWAALWAPIYNHDWFKRMAANSIRVDGPEIAEIQAAARRCGIFVSMGFSEAAAVSVGCMWNSIVLIADDGKIVNHHRKLVPTFYEKMVWASGDGFGLKVENTKIGKIGALICGENTNPLARYSLAAQGEQIHISAWPPIWPTRPPGSGTNFDNLAANRIRAGGHSFEAKAFGILNAGFMDDSMLNALLANGDVQAREVLETTPRAATQFLDPTGAVIGDTLHTEEGIAYATFELEQCVEPKQFHDIVGYYNRFDVFDVTIDRRRLVPATFKDAPETKSSALSSSENGTNDSAGDPQAHAIRVSAGNS